MKRSILSAVILASAACLFAGCATVVDVPEGAAPGVQVRDPMAPNARIRMNSVAIVDKSLQRWNTKVVEYQPAWLSIFSLGRPENQKYSKITVEGTNARRSATGTVEVWATFRNRTDYPLAIECRTQFFDREEAPVEGPTAWQRVQLPQQSVASYKEFSTNVMDVGYYYIEVREAR
jgi:hypothetical protein